ncbi:hypothetical protein Nmel_004310 [Mimus melanotis]
MRLLSRALRAAQAYRAAALTPRSLRAAPVAWLSARPGLEELFSAPSLRRLLEARARGEGGAAPQLAARVQRLRDKERELRDTRELAQDENEDFRKLAETEIASCEEEIAELKQQVRSPYKASVSMPFLN